MGGTRASRHHVKPRQLGSGIHSILSLSHCFHRIQMLGIDVAKALAIISAILLPRILISILQTAQSFSEGAVQLRQYSDIFNLETSAFHRMQLLKQRFDFLKERRLAKKGINILAWKGLKYETMPGGWIKKEPFAKSPQKPSSFSSSILSKGTAKVVPKMTASKISVATKTATSFKGTTRRPSRRPLRQRKILSNAASFATVCWTYTTTTGKWSSGASLQWYFRGRTVQG